MRQKITTSTYGHFLFTRSPKVKKTVSADYRFIVAINVTKAIPSRVLLVITPSWKITLDHGFSTPYL